MDTNAIVDVIGEMRSRRINSDRSTSPTLWAWAQRLADAIGLDRQRNPMDPAYGDVYAQHPYVVPSNTKPLPEGWNIQFEGPKLTVTKPDGTVSVWASRPKTNGSGMYDLCLALVREAMQEEFLCAAKRYQEARDAYERATFGGNWSPPKSLKHSDPILIEFTRARAEFQEKLRNLY